MFTVFNDAKRGTLSAWSWPSREAPIQRREYFMANGTIQGFEDFRYDFRLQTILDIYTLEAIWECLVSLSMLI